LHRFKRQSCSFAKCFYVGEEEEEAREEQSEVGTSCEARLINPVEQPLEIERGNDFVSGLITCIGRPDITAEKTVSKI
jgi:hypothetical protein